MVYLSVHKKYVCQSFIYCEHCPAVSSRDSMGTNGDQYFSATFNAMGIQDFPPFVSVFMLDSVALLSLVVENLIYHIYYGFSGNSRMKDECRML